MARVKVFDPTTGKWVYADKSFGKDGTSVTVKSVTESTADGGSNVVTFSDGKTVTIKNGSKGSPGTNGSDASVTATNIKNALGYTPADDADVRLLSENIVEIGTRAEIVQAVIAALPVYNGEVV